MGEKKKKKKKKNNIRAEKTGGALSWFDEDCRKRKTYLNYPYNKWKKKDNIMNKEWHLLIRNKYKELLTHKRNLFIENENPTINKLTRSNNSKDLWYHFKKYIKTEKKR